MFRKYGLLGVSMIVLSQVGLFLRVQPLAQWYFPLAWIGYILLIDAAVFKLKGDSIISSRPLSFVFMFLLSAAVWSLFEYIGYAFLKNWHYTGLEGFGSALSLALFGILSFGTVIPAVFETASLLNAIRGFDSLKLEHRHRITKRFLYLMILSGLLSLGLTLAYPRLFFPFIWISFFLILDPINYLHAWPSILSCIRRRKLHVPLSLFIGATLCGFLWEFWNFYAIPKWHYTLPLADFLKVFEMPLLGYLGYGPFGLELYSMYHFAVGIARHRGIPIFRY